MADIRQCAPIFSGVGSVEETVEVGLVPVFTTAPTSSTVAAGATIAFIATDNLNRAITYSLLVTPTGYSIAANP